MIDTIIHGDCMDVMDDMVPGTVDLILTSPFYNTSIRSSSGGGSINLTNTTASDKFYPYARYDEFVDSMTDEEYRDFTVQLFNGFEIVLKDNGVVLYNISYGSKGADLLIDVLHDVIHRAEFSIADIIPWKKSSAMPNNNSKNKLTRICELVFVLCRTSEFKTFNTNKKVKSVRKTGQQVYENVFNFVEAKNNDGACPFNKATFSSELCMKLLDIYAPPEAVVYDPFMGTGTTAVACKKMGLHYIGSELSEKQCAWAEDRLSKISFGEAVEEQMSLFN